MAGGTGRADISLVPPSSISVADLTGSCGATLALFRAHFRAGRAASQSREGSQLLQMNKAGAVPDDRRVARLVTELD